MTGAETNQRTTRDMPIGIDATGTRKEFDSMGKLDVPADRARLAPPLQFKLQSVPADLPAFRSRQIAPVSQFGMAIPAFADAHPAKQPDAE